MLRETLHTVDDLIRVLGDPELERRPLGQVIAVTINIGGAGADMQKILFNQLDHFCWNMETKELEVEV